MVRPVTAIIVFSLVLRLSGMDIYSPHSPSFYTIPDWLPGEVESEDTPGSDNSFSTVTATNRVVTEWELVPGSSTPNWSGTSSPALTGAIPQWADDHWGSYDQIFDFATAPYQPDDWPGCRIDNYGGCQVVAGDSESDATWLYCWANNELFDGDHMGGSSYATAVFARSVSNDVSVTTNLLCRRIAPVVQSAAIHTLDAWAEREYFAGLGQREPSHDLRYAPVKALPDDREISSRRVTGKTNLWSVADRMLSISRGSWRGGFSVPADPYQQHVSPYWSSQLFNNVYGDQIPADISWTSAGLSGLSNCCAVLRGVTNSVPWGGTGTNGYFFAEMVPEDFGFGTHVRPATTPGHGFGFSDLCSVAFAPEVVDMATNRTLRLESSSQAAINQAMAVMNRTICSSGPVSAGPGTERRFARVREFESEPMTLADLGFAKNYAAGTLDLVSDLHFNLSERTNYWEESSSVWAPDSSFSDSVELSSNEVSMAVSDNATDALFAVSATEIVRRLNEERFSGDPGRAYHVFANALIRNGNSIGLSYTSDIAGFAGMQYRDYLPDDMRYAVAVRCRNRYSLREAQTNDYSRLPILPMRQAWNTDRVASVQNICTAAAAVMDGARTNVEYHCHTIRQTAADSIQTLLASEWTTHRFRLLNAILERRTIDWTDPKTYVDFSAGQVAGVMDSVVVPAGSYELSWGLMPYVIRVSCDASGVWSADPESENSYIGALAYVPIEAFVDYTAHNITDREEISARCRQRITNVVDWNWRSICPD